MADDFKVVFELDVARALRSATDLADRLSTITAELGKLDTASKDVQNLSVSFGRNASSANEAAKAQARASASIRGYQANIAKVEKHDAWRKEVRELGEVQAATNRVQRAQVSLQEARDKVSSVQGAAPTEQVEAYRQLSVATTEASQAQDAFDRANRQTAQGLSTTRYAMYDMSRTLGVLGGAAVGLSTAIYGVSIAWERDFANVIRTSNLDPLSAATERMRRDFIALQGVLPVTASELAEIGTLAGQLGIQSQAVSEFTRIVAQFAATTDLSAEQAATAFGRLLALLPDMSNGTYTLEQLASSILLVGTNSVATEGEITKISTQLSSMAGYAGLSADELVGLAGALASVGTQPELARGTITRLFTQMGRAVSSGGEMLRGFAQTAGVSSEEFASAFGQAGFGQVLLSFINGLGDITRSGGDAVATLRDLGITSVRDVPALTRLAIAADSLGTAGALINQTFTDANKGLRDGTELQKQYSVIADTVAARLQVLVNNLQGFITTIGQGGGIFGGFIDFLNEVLRGLTEMANNPGLNALLQTGVILSGIVGTLLLIGAAVAAGFAGMIAITQSLVGLGTAAQGSSLSYGRLLDMMRATGPIGAVAATTIRAVGFAVGTLTAAVTAAGLVVLAGQLLQAGEMASGASISVEKLAERLAGLGESSTIIPQELGRWGNAFQQFDDIPLDKIQRTFELLGSGLDMRRAPVELQKVISNINSYDKALAQLVQAGNVEQAAQRLRELQDTLGLTRGQVRSAFPEYLAEVARQAEISGTSIRALTGDVDGILSANDRLAFNLGLSEEQFETWQRAVASASAGAVDLGNAITAATNKGVFSLEKFNTAMEAQVVAFENWEKNLLTLLSRGAGVDVIQSLLQEGPAVAGQLAQSLVDNFGTELGKSSLDLIRRGAEMGDAVAGGFSENSELLVQAALKGEEAGAAMLAAILEGADPKRIAEIIAQYNIPLTVPVELDTEPARQSMYQFLNSSWATEIRANVVFHRAQDQLWQNYGFRAFAGGGSVRGPGTGTSDSVPAMLSNGEYVIRSASVRQYGHGFLDAINRGVAKFAQGGPVGSRTPSVPTSSGSGSVTNVNVVQNNPVTRDPLRQLREDSEMVVAGIWR